ncbi:hypothetical protein PJL18_03882 [Paenarthrobacter nicotinovorans]|nr:hypothetical protein [Paenarthrobacter nicotinovorans]
MGVVFADGGQVTCVGLFVAAKDREVGVAEEGAGMVTGFRGVGGSEPDEPGHLGHIGSGEASSREPVLGQDG